MWNKETVSSERVYYNIDVKVQSACFGHSYFSWYCGAAYFEESWYKWNTARWCFSQGLVCAGRRVDVCREEGWCVQGGGLMCTGRRVDVQGRIFICLEADNRRHQWDVMRMGTNLIFTPFWLCWYKGLVVIYIEHDHCYSAALKFTCILRCVSLANGTTLHLSSLQIMGSAVKIFYMQGHECWLVSWEMP
jgi:hypothetical protein